MPEVRRERTRSPPRGEQSEKGIRVLLVKGLEKVNPNLFVYPWVLFLGVSMLLFIFGFGKRLSDDLVCFFEEACLR